MNAGRFFGIIGMVVLQSSPFATAQELRSLWRRPADTVAQGLSQSADGSTLVVSTPFTYDVWDRDGQRLRRSIRLDLAQTLNQVAVTPDGSTFYGTTTNSWDVVGIDTRTGETVETLPRTGYLPVSTKSSPDGRHILIRTQQSVAVYRRGVKRLLWERYNAGRDAVVTSDGHTVITSNGPRLSFRDIETGNVTSFRSGAVGGEIQLSSNDRFLLNRESPTADVLDLTTGRTYKFELFKAGRSTFSWDGSTVLITERNGSRSVEWDFSAGTLVWEGTYETAVNLSGMAPAPDGSSFYLSSENWGGTVHVHGRPGGGHLRSLYAPEVSAIAVNDLDEFTYVANFENAVYSASMSTGQDTFQEHVNAGSSWTVSPRQRYIVWNDAFMTRVWDCSLKRSVSAFTTGVWSRCAIDDTKGTMTVATVLGASSRLRKFDLFTGAVLSQRPHSTANVYPTADPSVLCVARATRLGFIREGDLSDVYDIPFYAPGDWNISFSSGNILGATDAPFGRLVLFDASDGKPLGYVTDHLFLSENDRYARLAGIAPDGTIVAQGPSNALIRIDLEVPKVINVWILPEPKYVRGVWFDPAMSRLIVSSDGLECFELTSLNAGRPLMFTANQRTDTDR
ncbi:MAG: WD40 repeat domain-containing protein [Armatimonadetes bacterium]|nr:WD40 repeat domain-containing protein [Armatimonadota bacterium]